MIDTARYFRVLTAAISSPLAQRHRLRGKLVREYQGVPGFTYQLACRQAEPTSERIATVKDRNRRFFLERIIAEDLATQSLTPMPQIANEAALKDRAHLEYLNRLVAEGVVPKSLATDARTVWWLARLSAGRRLPVPAAAAFPTGPIEYLWINGPHQLTVEIPVMGPCHWTYRNSLTGELWGVEIILTDGLPLRIKLALASFVVVHTDVA